MAETKKIIICGLKGVGKSIIYQKLVKKYSSSLNQKLKSSPIVNYQEEFIFLKNQSYLLIDTPSLKLSSQNLIEKEIQKQTDKLLETCVLIVWVLDLNQELNSQIEQVNKHLWQFLAPQFLVFNKKDLVKEPEYQLTLYQGLGRSQFISLSAFKNEELEKLVEKIATSLLIKEGKYDDDFILKSNLEEEKINLIIFGPPNSGKSTLMNYLLEKERSLVSQVAGTTKEPVISNWQWNKLNFQLIDTAGITKESRKKEQMVLRKTDLAWVVIDATFPLSKQILQIIHLGEKYQKPLLIIINKCDLVKKKEQEKIVKEINMRLKSLRFVPLVLLSALQGKGINELFSYLEQIFQQSQKKFSKRILHQCLKGMLERNPPPYYGKKKLKIYFMLHEKGLVSYFIFLVNNKNYVHFSYQRYIVNYLRDKLELKFLPIKLVFKNSK